MKPQAKAASFSLLVHALCFLAALGLGRQAMPVQPPIGLDFSILPSDTPADGSPAPPVQQRIAPVEKKVEPRPTVKKTLPTVKKKVPPPMANNAPLQENSIPVAAGQSASTAQDSAQAPPEQAAPAASAHGAGAGQPHNDGSGRGVYTTGQLDGPLAVLAKSPPAYPPAAKRRNIQGWIKIRFIVDEQGQVGQVSVLAAEPEGIFEQSVLRCVNSWRFRPGTVKGMAVKALVEQTITFKLEG
ncbi:TonB family protein [Desulfobulbus sp.]|uniref:energy transducer TonB n=1 Tax=Desulfobulbus sp. TaxID=895 RepID=UPI00286F8F29|nr:TonB family protein [Desulfobulbus sp.]